MRLVQHLVRADIRQFRLLLAVWLILVVSGAILDGVRPMLAADLAVRSAAGLVGSLLWLAELLFGVALIALLVQAHPLVGSDAFWMTRPISPRALLAAKAILLGVVMIALPVFADVGLMAFYEVPPTRIATVSLQTTLFWMFWIVALMSAAALTANLTTFALLLGGALLAIALILAATVAIAMGSFAELPSSASASFGTDEPTSDIMLWVLLIVSGVTLLIVQYRTRVRSRAIATGVGGILVAIVVTWAWPWPILAPTIVVPAWAADASMLRLASNTETVKIDEDLSWLHRHPVWNVVRARVTLAGIAPGWSALVGAQQAVVQLDAKTRVTSPFPAHPTEVAIESGEASQSRSVVRRLLGVRRLLDTVPTSDDTTILLFLSDPDLRRLTPANGTYEGRFQVVLTRYDIEAVLPLRNGAIHQNGAYRFAIHAVERARGRLSIVAHESNALSMFDRRPPQHFTFYLRNLQAGEALHGAEQELRDDVALPFSMGFAGSQNPGFTARALLVQFPPGYGLQEKPLRLDDRWIEQAELVIVSATPAGSVERSLAIANFPLRAP